LDGNPFLAAVLLQPRLPYRPIQRLIRLRPRPIRQWRRLLLPLRLRCLPPLRQLCPRCNPYRPSLRRQLPLWRGRPCLPRPGPQLRQRPLPERPHWKKNGRPNRPSLNPPLCLPLRRPTTLPRRRRRRRPVIRGRPARDAYSSVSRSACRSSVPSRALPSIRFVWNGGPWSSVGVKPNSRRTGK
jgi:hypothetical protein